MGSIKVLVTGASGQLGKTIEELYKENDFNIEFIFFDKSNFDITDKPQINQIFNQRKFDYCINCAAYTNVEQAEKTTQLAYEINAEGVKNLALVCKANNVILIHISTDYVFDGEKSEPYTVDDTPNPINEYGKSKLLGEQYIEETILQYFIVRTSWLYSKKHGNNFYKTILKKAEKDIELYITDEQIGCPTNTVNLSKFIIDIIHFNNKNFGIFHFCDKKAMSWYYFSLQILKENNLSHKIKLVKAKNYHTFARRPKNSVLTN